MHPVVLDVLAVQAALVPEVLLKLLVNVVSHWLPAETVRNKQRHTTVKDHNSPQRKNTIIIIF